MLSDDLHISQQPAVFLPNTRNSNLNALFAYSAATASLEASLVDLLASNRPSGLKITVAIAPKTAKEVRHAANRQ